MIPYGRQTITDNDIQQVDDVLRSDWLTQGPAIGRFENCVAKYCSAKFATAICNATAALHLACRALNLKAGDIVWTCTNTFVASANCALYCGATIDFIDIQPQTYNMCPQLLAMRLERARLQGKLPKIIIVVHFAGQSCEMKSIRELAKLYDIYIIEDASHALGATYLNSKVGNCEYSDITVFSFHPVKMITTGEGGMALTNDHAIYQKLQLLRSHGITRDPDKMEVTSEGDWYYQQIDLGHNYRMTDIQAALGISQMQKINQFIERRRYLVDRYNTCLQQLPIVLPWQHKDSNSSWHLYVIQLEDKSKRTTVFNFLRKAGINVNVHYIPVHTQPFYQRLGFKWGDYPNAESYYKAAITLPLFYGLTDEKQDYVIEKLYEILK